MILEIQGLIGKKGLIVIGSPRSGTHHLCQGLYSLSNIENKKYLGEIYQNFDTGDILKNLDSIINTPEFTFSSFVQWVPKNLLVQHKEYLKSNFYLINLRRLDKVAQYRSWCMARLTWQYKRVHSVNWDLIEKDLPFTATDEDIDNFLIEQNADYLFDYDKVVYYEQLTLKSSFKTNEYTKSNDEIFSNYDLVLKRLSNYRYVE
jgi:hypothetical protein